MLVTPDGKQLTRSKKDVQDILREIAPKNKEQEAILAKAIGESIERNRKQKITQGLSGGYSNMFKKNAKMRQDKQKGDWRLVAAIPKEMAYVARKVWGDDVFTDPSKFNEAFVKDELGRYCLTVDPKEI